MYKYQTSKYGIKIKKVECVKETEKTVFIKNLYYGETDNITKQSKNGDWNKYFNSFDDAKKYLIDRSNRKIECLKNDIAKELENLDELKELKNV